MSNVEGFSIKNLKPAVVHFTCFLRQESALLNEHHVVEKWYHGEQIQVFKLVLRWNTKHEREFSPLLMLSPTTGIRRLYYIAGEYARTLKKVN